jgi:hypothetical protein
MLKLTNAKRIAMDENKQAPAPDAEQTPAPALAPPTPPEQPTPTDPAPTPPITQPLAPAEPVKLPGDKKKQVVLAVIIGAIIVLAGAAYAAYAYVTNTPDYLLGKATEQFGKNANNAMAARFKFVSGTESTGVSFSGDFAVHGDSANKNGELLIGFGTGTSRVSLTARSVDDNLYLKAGSLANLPNLLKAFSTESAAVYDTPEMKAALSRIDNKWFSITKSDIQDLGVTSTSISPQMKPQELQQVLDIYRKHKVLQADKNYPDEKIDNVNTAHFTLKINKAELVAFMTDLKNANIQSVKVTDEDIQSASKDADNFAKNAVADVWIARDTKQFKQMRFAGIEKGSEGSLTLTFITDVPQFEKLEKPTDALPLNELLTTFLGPTTVNL